jgi:hypothetical protein
MGVSEAISIFNERFEAASSSPALQILEIAK